MLRRRWRRRLGLTLLGLFIIFFFYSAIGDSASEIAHRQKDGRTRSRRRGIPLEIIVGHYNGPLHDTKSTINYTQEELDSNHFNPLPNEGSKGQPVRLLGEDEALADRLFQINYFNVIASDRIPSNRTLPEIRRSACRDKVYPVDLPTTSVVIVFHNEAWSTLIRTVTSVINRSPKHLLKEIILVDDFSSRSFLKEPLRLYMESLTVPGTIIRSNKRIGLIQARLLGAANASGDVLTFLDSHCECTDGWLEPLLARISQDKTAVVCPVIDVINDQSFQYQKGIDIYRGGFNWNLQFRWYSPPPSEMKRRGDDVTAPIRTPTMAGGLFSIDRKYFYAMGSYDKEMKIWGGENLEMSFRIWQCGGRLEILPCSHVGHVFRKRSPHDFPEGDSSKTLSANLVRLAEVWMDEWKNVFYLTSPAASNLSHKIDVSERRTLRKKLGCKGFSWYLSNVWPEHFMPTNTDFFGRIRHILYGKCLQLVFVKSPLGRSAEKRVSAEPCNTNYQQVKNVMLGYCLVNRPTGRVNWGRKSVLQLSPCTKGHDLWQFWVFRKNGRLKSDEHQCLSAVDMKNKVWVVQLKECSESESERWLYKKLTSRLIHHQSGLCLDAPMNVLNPTVVHAPVLKKCSAFAEGQRWYLEETDWKSRS